MSDCCNEQVNGQAAGGGSAGQSVTQTTVWEVDWSAESTFDIAAAGDGTYNFDDGLEYEAVNTAASTSMDITNGTGLVLVGTAGATTHTANNAPLINVRFNAAAGADNILSLPFNTSGPWTAWWYLSAFDISTTNDILELGFRTGNSAADAFGAAGYVAGGPTNESGNERAYVQSNGTRANTPAALDTVVQTFDVYAVRIVDERFIEVYGGVWAGGWPTWAAMRKLGGYQDIVNGVVSDQMFRRQDGYILTAVGHLGGAGTNSMTVERQRLTLEVLP